MAFEDPGVILGLVGIGTGLVSIVYARTQARAAEGQARETRRQAEQATHMTVLASNQHLFDRLHSARERISKSHLLLDLQREVPDLQQAIAAAGGWDDYILIREVTEVFQDAYFMRRDGIITDAYWTDLAGNAALWTKLPAFHRVFDFSVERKLVDPGFVEGFRPVLEGKAWIDPKRS
jgi:hypothetical protein